MERTLDKPVEDIHALTEKFRCGGEDLEYALAHVQGYRTSMEDAHVHLPFLPKNDELNLPEIPNISLFAIFDGHGGTHSSFYCAEHLLDEMQRNDNYTKLVALVEERKFHLESVRNNVAKDVKMKKESNLTQLTDSKSKGKVSIGEVIPESSAVEPSEDEIKFQRQQNQYLAKLITETFISLDDKLLENRRRLQGAEKSTGTTAVCCFITESHLVVGNLGDSRLLFVSNSDVAFVTNDHKPYLPGERERIEQTGFSVNLKRVNSILALSRALGDFEFKKHANLDKFNQAVSVQAEIDFVKRTEKDEFVVLACDGVWDVMSNAEACDFIQGKLKQGLSLQQICEDITKACVKSRDNVSVMIVAFNNYNNF